MKALRETLSAVGLLFAVAVVAFHYGAMPGNVPVHFNAQGMANRWGDKAVLWALPGLAFVVYVLMTLGSLISPRKMNLPVSEEKRAAAAPLALAMMGWLKVEIVWTFALVSALTVRVALGRAEGLGFYFLPVQLAVVFGTIGWYLWRMTKVAA